MKWNRLNLLQKVSRGDEVLVKYAYLADGTKLSAIDGAGDGFEYIGSLTFRRSGGSRQLESSAFSHGRIYREGSGQAVSYVPYFHITDHLGSVREVIDGRDGYLVEENHYYPFGERWDYGINPTGHANRYQYNGKEDQNIEFDLPTLDYGARHYSPSTARWLSPDPLAEKYYNLSPYAFCGNDPVNYVDPDGRDIYRYDNESGTFHLYQKTDDDYDQVAEFKYHKDTGEYELKSKRNGKVKLKMDNIEKGILSDGINLLSDSQVWSTDDVSIEGFQNFIVAYSDMIGREMGGYYYTEKGGTDLKYINLGRGMNNTRISSQPGPGISRTRPDLYEKVDIHTNWHTHPSNAETRLNPSPKDNDFKSTQSKNGVKRFIILTGGTSPIEF